VLGAGCNRKKSLKEFFYWGKEKGLGDYIKGINSS